MRSVNVSDIHMLCHYDIIYMYVWMQSLCMFYMRDMTFQTSMHVFNVIYLRVCGCTVCWHTTPACFSQAHALSLAF